MHSKHYSAAGKAKRRIDGTLKWKIPAMNSAERAGMLGRAEQTSRATYSFVITGVTQ
jgi:hypothetical protein